jgi:hypothetical protein
VEGEKRDKDGQREREAAARKAVDVERLLPGENPSTGFVDDCRHWLRVYTELLDLKRTVMGSMTQVKEEAEPEVRAEIEGTDLVIMRAEAERFQRRLDYWRHRLGELEKAEASRRA